jgi:nicotinate-nucleotide pyrophosphorylase (carboxylating)
MQDLLTNLSPLISAWLKEDIPSFDYGGWVVGSSIKTAKLYCKQNGVLCGVPFVNEIFKQLNCKVSWLVPEGTRIYVNSSTPHSHEPSSIFTKESRLVVAELSGSVRDLLIGERLALNIVCRASGIATKAMLLKEIALNADYHGIIAATRKTTPGFRLVEKYACLVGGCDTHRMDLSSMIMLKDNHIWASKSIANAVTLAKRAGGFSLKITVECQSEAEAREAIAAGADIVMLDNFTPEGCKVAAKNLKASFPQVLVECSGGLNEVNCTAYFDQNIDILSFGCLTQSVKHIDFSLKVDAQ